MAKIRRYLPPQDESRTSEKSSNSTCSQIDEKILTMIVYSVNTTLLDYEMLAEREPQSESQTGPMRFELINERTTSEQIETLNDQQRKCFENIKARWENAHPQAPFSDDMYLRFARCSPGKPKFNADAAYSVMENFDQRHLLLTAEQLEVQLRTKTLFPAPGLRTKHGKNAVFYIRPSRHHPSYTPNNEILNSMAYCINTMCEAEKESTEGISVLFNMEGVSLDNLSASYCYQFVKLLQERFPVRIRTVLLVNTPNWFRNIWNILSSIFSPGLRKKVRMVSELELHDYLEDGFETYLPDDMAKGLADTDAMVEDFITYRKQVEGGSEFRQERICI